MSDIADIGVTATNDYAAICKFKAVQLGYYKDPFLEKFLSFKARTSEPRKAPEINRGYYLRSTTVAFIVEKFIDRFPDGQIISLGAGYDTLFWRLHAHGLIKNNETCEEKIRNIVYVEIDMSPVVMHKITSIRRNKELSAPLGVVSFKGEDMHSDNYHLLSFDLRQRNRDHLKVKLLQECGLDTSKATLCLTECVLIFMPHEDSLDLVQWLRDIFKSNLNLLNYEQCNMLDGFGATMIKNMKERNCELLGVEWCSSLEKNLERFSKVSLSYNKGWTLLDVLKNCISPALVERIFSIEFLDENELLDQLLEHYCITIASGSPIEWLSDDEYWLSKTTQ